MLGRLATDFRQALVILRRRPAALVVPVVTMALGIGASTAIFSALYVALFNPLPYTDPGRLVMARAVFGGRVNPTSAAADFYDYRDRSGAFESLAAYRGRASRMTIRIGDNAESAAVMQVSWNLFQTLGVNPILGRRFSAAEGMRSRPDTAIVSCSYWRRSLGGERSVIGRTIPLTVGEGGVVTLTVIGVMPEGFSIADAADVWMPMQENNPGNRSRRMHSWVLVGRLTSGLTLTDAQKRVDAISRQLQKDYPDTNRNKALLLTPLQRALTERDQPTLFLLMAAVGVLLLVACADVAGLLLSRGAARQSEMAVRSALGATRTRLVRQALAESFLIAALAGGAGLVLAMWLRVLVLRYVPLASLGIVTLPIGGPVLAFAVGVTLATTALVGLVPALLGTRVSLAADLKCAARMSETKSRAVVRQTLVVLQVAISVVLLVSATLLGRTVMQLRSVDPGFRAGGLLTATIELAGPAYRNPAAKVRFFTDLLDDLRTLPGVVHANISNNLPILDSADNLQAWDADHPPSEPNGAPFVGQRYVLPGYFHAMGIPLLAGRDLSTTDTGVLVSGRKLSADEAATDHPPVVVISESTARALFPRANPIGRRLAVSFGGPTPVVAEVVGVAGDVHLVSLSSDYSLAFYAPYQFMALSTMRLAVRTAGDGTSLTAAIRAALARRDRGLALSDVRTMDAVVAQSLEGFALRAGAISLFGAAALLLAVLGVYGVLAFTVSRRRHDIGLRMVMGATRAQILASVIVRGMSPVVAGVAVGLGGALAAGRTLRHAFNLPPTDVPTLIGVASCLLAAAVAACLIPGCRAVRVDPVVALRTE